MANKTKSDIGWVYIVSNPSFEDKMVYKIGSTQNIDHRMKGLETSTPYPFELELCLYSKRYQEIERELHSLFKEKRINREFFKLCPEDFQTIIDKYSGEIRLYEYGCPTTIVKSDKTFFGDLKKLFREQNTPEGIKNTKLIMLLLSNGYDLDTIDFFLRYLYQKAVIEFCPSKDVWTLIRPHYSSKR